MIFSPSSWAVVLEEEVDKAAGAVKPSISEECLVDVVAVEVDRCQEECGSNSNDEQINRQTTLNRFCFKILLSTC